MQRKKTTKRTPPGSTLNTNNSTAQTSQLSSPAADSIDLRHGDSFELLPGIADGSIDAVVTDPPYGSTDCAWDHKINLAEFWRQMWRVLKPAAVVVSFAAQPFATDMILSARKQFRYELIWFKARKVGFLNANRQPLRQHELVLIFGRLPKQSTYHPQLVAGKPYKTMPSTDTSVYRKTRKQAHINLGTRHPTSVLQLNDFGGPRIHPTQKPEDLCRWIVRSYSNPGDLILDPFTGSGSTPAACHAEGRRFVGFERDRAIYERACKRLGLQP